MGKIRFRDVLPSLVAAFRSDAVMALGSNILRDASGTLFIDLENISRKDLEANQVVCVLTLLLCKSHVGWVCI